MTPTFIAVFSIVILGVLIAERMQMIETSGLDYSDKVKKFAQAVAVAEGFYVAGSTPQVRNNPGNIKMDGKEITVFPTDADGWAALYKLVERAFNGTSRFYQPTMTISQMAKTYTGESAFMNWSNNVSKVLGVSPDTTLLEYINS